MSKINYLKNWLKKIQVSLKKFHTEFLIFFIDKGITYLETSEGKIPLSIFGNHNLSNLSGAMWIAQMMGINFQIFMKLFLLLGSLKAFRMPSKR